MNNTLGLDDILDLRAYEKIREESRSKIIEAKRLRRVSIGPIMTLTFESRETIWFQVQEMARAERIISEDALCQELDTYNPLIPQKGHLSASLFLELTTKDELLNWLPKLVGIERSLELVIGQESIPCMVEEGHEAQLTREDVTASVHYIKFALSESQIAAFGEHESAIVSVHPNYLYQAPLSEQTCQALMSDLGGNF